MMCDHDLLLDYLSEISLPPSIGIGGDIVLPKRIAQIDDQFRSG